MNEISDPLELNVLKNFYDKICAENPQDNSISDSKFVRDTRKQLTVALMKADHKCSCAMRSYDMCEICMGSSRELYYLRNFYRMIRNAKKNNLEPNVLQEFIVNTGKWLLPPEPKKSRRKNSPKEVSLT